jgi:hypothetical protein
MRGGKREGAGRKKVLTYETTVIKIPLLLKDLVKSILDYEIGYLNQKGEFDLNNRYQKTDYDLSYLNQTSLIDSGYENQIHAIQALIKSYASNANDSPRWAHAKKLLQALNLILTPKI